MSQIQDFKKRLITYMNIEAMSRYEEPVVDELKKNINGFKVMRDKLGSVIFYKKASVENAPKIMIAAHMDEVGYIVRDIHNTGQVLLSPIGGIWPTVVVGTKAKLITEDNKVFEGVFGHTSIHIMENHKISKAITNDELYADFGFENKKDALRHNVQIGDRVQLTGSVVQFHNPDLIGGKAMDNRAGVAVLESIAKEVAHLDLQADLYLVGTVQEEVGTRGAKSSVSVVNPDIAIALDTTSSHDTIGTIAGTTALFKGAALRIKDGGTLMDTKLVAHIQNIAKKNKIKAYKFVAMGGGTDAAQLQFAQGGAATLTLSLPQRYLHSPIGVCSVSDLLATKNLLVEFVKNFNETEFNTIKYK
ncbi:M20/M25/M40 family metallo-hydrolase [Mycoplasma nasistruthionis]|uniref:M42 family metallopeptidase n=1 Tax=Mycoplasma nasistruthionis TaxID=353852 RepID=A0A5B7XUM8_9MOLU|nr:M42 family metallopeptidase [Mycoplasma nasistruthionis]QCZ36576.1 M42 family metallopeptidase [Mycoplasma nasistruthionis]